MSSVNVSTSTRALGRRLGRGFTLPELMVSLVAGLFVTMAVVALAKTATTTFHEQVRSTASEMALRLASQRFSADLERISYMSTGNIRWDPQIVRMDGAPLALDGNGVPVGATGSRYLELNDLQGIRIYVAGAALNPNITLESDNALFPEAIDLTGNFTTNDQYIISQVSAPPNPLTAACPAQSVILNENDAAVVKILHRLMPDGSLPIRPDLEAQAILRSIFLPVAGTTFPARVVDPNSGSTHFVMVNAATVVAGVATISFAPSLTGCPILWGGQGKGGTSGFGEGLQIAPLQTVRWRIQRLANARLDPTEDAAMKFDLTRQYVDVVTSAVVGNPEVVSEYAVDLKVAFTVDFTPGPPPFQAFDFEDTANNALWSRTGGVNGSPRASLADPAPHRIRSVRFRLSERTAKPDRSLDLPGPAAGYPLRYCLDGPPGPGCTRYSRVRTLVSEVALTNQARMSY